MDDNKKIISDDNISIKSSESVTTSGEYEIVPSIEADVNSVSDDQKTLEAGKDQLVVSHKIVPLSPVLASIGDIAELQKNMDEVIHEMDFEEAEPTSKAEEAESNSISNFHATTSNILKTTKQLHSLNLKLDDDKGVVLKARSPNSSASTTTPDKKVGKSIFYDCLDASPMAEKQDNMKPDDDDDYIDQECTIFSGLTYLGAASLSAPKCEQDIHRIMSELNASAGEAGLKVSVSIPSCSDGLVVLYDALTNAVFAHYEIHRILFYARGAAESVDQACFAFTWSHGECVETAIYQCHVFRCNIPEAVNQVSSCFTKAFQRVPPSLTCSITSSAIDQSMQASLMVASMSITSDVSGNRLKSAMYEFNCCLEIKEKMLKNSYSSVVRDRSCFKLRCNTDKEVCITVKQSPSDTLPPLFIERCFGVLLSPGKLVRQADMQLLDMASMGYIESSSHAPFSTYQIRAEWKASDKAFEQLNLESQKMYLTVAVDLVIKGIQEPVRFVIETQVTICPQNEMRFMEQFMNKRPLMVKFYIQLKENGEGTWEVESIDPSDEIIEPVQPSMLNLKMKNFSKMVRSTSIASIDFDDLSPTDISEQDDEPLLSGTGEVSKDCSQDRLDEWRPIIIEWDNTGKRPKHLANLVRAGIPEALRCKIWQKLANQRTDLADCYRVLISQETKSENVILRDINRTFPAHKFFKESGGLGQDSLYKVSKAYSVYDQEVGYCQGLSFIAASLLLHMPEEEAFCVLIAIMYDYKQRDLFKLGFETLSLRLYQLNQLIKDQLPDLFDHFQATGVEAHMFSTQWFLTLFTARFPLYFVFHILDVFLLDGMNVLFQVAMSLLYLCRKDLLLLDFEGILKYVRISLPRKCRNEQQAQRLMKLACDWKVKKLKKYEEEYMVQKEETDKEELILKQYELKFCDERKMLQNEISYLQEKVQKLNNGEKNSETIILDYKQIIQRQEQHLSKLTETVDGMTKIMSSCQNCSSQISNAHKDSLDSEHPLGPLDPLNEASLRIRELELELAQAKLDKVEAECRSQDLNHQLVSTLSELHGNKSMGKDKDNTSWQPSWMSKTLNSIQEKVKKDSQNIPSFQSYTSDITQVKPREVALPAKMLATRNSINVINYSPTQTTTTLSASSGGSPLKTNTTHYNELN